MNNFVTRLVTRHSPGGRNSTAAGTQLIKPRIGSRFESDAGVVGVYDQEWSEVDGEEMHYAPPISESDLNIQGNTQRNTQGVQPVNRADTVVASETPLHKPAPPARLSQSYSQRRSGTNDLSIQDINQEGNASSSAVSRHGSGPPAKQPEILMSRRLTNLTGEQPGKPPRQATVENLSAENESESPSTKQPQNFASRRELLNIDEADLRADHATGASRTSGESSMDHVVEVSPHSIQTKVASADNSPAVSRSLFGPSFRDIPLSRPKLSRERLQAETAGGIYLDAQALGRNDDGHYGSTGYATTEHLTKEPVATELVAKDHGNRPAVTRHVTKQNAVTSSAVVTARVALSGKSPGPDKTLRNEVNSISDPTPETSVVVDDFGSRRHHSSVNFNDSGVSASSTSETAAPVLPPVIKVSIGRIEVRSTEPAKVNAAYRPRPRGPSVSLNDYLKSRGGG